ncbi:MarR family winged helix-turn-helix transcriptional regulator [Hydrogenophaga intermedia]|uniref:Transcriptional regulator n=1 Tax=Hydrogenophaga intermedia TaxID=65786 RepID=A0A1L1PKI2_HYDIT|nr:MarR family transcriptional regulator [Hydrogenophaga intermedia]TMU72346.1 MarR family transcriptional regulator [Hydrogenophaga intermedia]CDN89890.1 Transcriptional regulator [Hydrogenophaga intermedia]
MTHPPDRLLYPERQADFLLYRLYRIHITAGRKVVQMCEERHGMTRREWRVLSFLAENEGVLSSELAERAMLDRARTSRTITSLAGKRLIERRPKPHDRREVQIFLSEEGRRVHQDIFPRIAAVNHALVEGLSSQQRQALDALVAHVQAQADAMIDGAAPLTRDNPDDEL